MKPTKPEHLNIHDPYNKDKWSDDKPIWLLPLRFLIVLTVGAVLFLLIT